MYDNSPSRLENVYIQRDPTNSFYEQINISGSDIIVYNDEFGQLNADKISVWALKYNIGTNGIISGESYNISSSWATNATYANSANSAINATSAAYATYLNGYSDTYFQPALYNTLYNITSSWSNNAVSAPLYLLLSGGDLSGRLGLVNITASQGAIFNGQLQVKQATNTGGIALTNSNSTALVYLWAGATEGHLDSSYVSHGVLAINSAGGYVGIGTSDPQKPLHVQGEISCSAITAASITMSGSISLNIKTYTPGTYSFAKYADITVGGTLYKIALYS